MIMISGRGGLNAEPAGPLDHRNACLTGIAARDAIHRALPETPAAGAPGGRRPPPQVAPHREEGCSAVSLGAQLGDFRS
jgi:hypothetical protein